MFSQSGTRSATRCIRFIIQCIRQTLVLKIFGFDLQTKQSKSITMKQLVDLSKCIYNETERKKKEKKKGRE